MAVSPDGSLIAYREITERRDVVRVISVDEMSSLGDIDVSDVRPRRLMFIDNDRMVLIASDSVRSVFYDHGEWEQSAAFLYDVRDGSLFRLLNGTIGLTTRQPSLGRIIGRTPTGDSVFMPAFVDEPAENPHYGLYGVDTELGLARVVARGLPSTIDWLVDPEARGFVREDYDKSAGVHRIWTVFDSDTELLYEERTEELMIDLIGQTHRGEALVYRSLRGATEPFALYSLDPATGDASGPMLTRENASIERALLDINRIVLGAEYGGFYPTYQFFSPERTARIEKIQKALQGASARLVGWSDGFDRLVVLASGGWTSGIYLLFTEGQPQPTVIARQRPEITRDHVARTAVAEYAARDGLVIPALVTGQADILAAGNAPLIVLPHGGLSGFDHAGFDWLTQFFASRGYVVLQPQFRGSAGFGREHRIAGDGELGRRMQTDLDDGVAHLVDLELVDPERVCIVGMSYGGYAALAAGAFSPNLYRCHVSINGISSIRPMLREGRRDDGRDSWVVDYWEDWIGTDERGRRDLASLSPVQFAEAFQGAVLLLHARDDTVVPLEQSRRMGSALERAGKDVEFVELRGGDHWLSSQEARDDVLRAVAEFIEQHL